jgi:hypothetical protein
MVRDSGHAAPSDALPEMPDAPHGLPQGFWDAAPESTAEEPLSLPSRYVRERESNDRDDLSADWLARATEAPIVEDAYDDDDPAEIPADSLSMISEASRYAAAQADDDDNDALSER